MKNLKKIVAIVLALTVLSTVAFAMTGAKADSKYSLTYEVSDVYTESGENYVDVSFYLNQTAGTDDLTSIVFQPDAYDVYGNTVTFKTTVNKDNVSFVSATSEYFTIDSSNTASTPARGLLNFAPESEDALTITPDDALFTIKFKALKSDVGSYSIYSKIGELTIMDGAANAIKGTTNLTLPVATDIEYTVAPTVVDPDPVAIEKVAADYTNFTADEVEFKNLWVAEYKLTGKAADKFFKITKVVVNGTKAGEAASKEFAGFETEFGGEAEITFKAALSGVDAPDSMSFDITAEYVD